MEHEQRITSNHTNPLQDYHNIGPNQPSCCTEVSEVGGSCLSFLTNRGKMTMDSTVEIFHSKSNGDYVLTKGQLRSTCTTTHCFRKEDCVVSSDSIFPLTILNLQKIKTMIHKKNIAMEEVF